MLALIFGMLLLAVLVSIVWRVKWKPDPRFNEPWWFWLWIIPATCWLIPMGIFFLEKKMPMSVWVMLAGEMFIPIALFATVTSVVAVGLSHLNPDLP
jgi:hypothetical protein